MKKLKFIIIILFSLNTINCFSRTDTIKCFSSWTTLDTITENLNIGDTLVFSNCGSPQLESLPAYTLSYASIPLYIIVGNEFLWYWSAYQAVKPEPNTFAYNYSIWQSNQHANISEYSMANISILQRKF